MARIVWLLAGIVVCIGCGEGTPKVSVAPLEESAASPTTPATSAPAWAIAAETTPTLQLVSTQVAKADAIWPAFRGPGGMGVSDAKGLPLSWSKDEGVVWKTELPGAGASSPIVWGDRIYLTSYTGYFVPGEDGGSLDDLQRQLLAINRNDGQIVWSKSVAAKLPEEQQIRDHGFAANTPAADAERVYVFFGKTGVFAFDRDGNQVWQADVGDKTSGWGTSSSPVLYKDLVFINASVESESLVALDRKTGKER